MRDQSVPLRCTMCHLPGFQNTYYVIPQPVCDTLKMYKKGSGKYMSRFGNPQNILSCAAPKNAMSECQATI